MTASVHNFWASAALAMAAAVALASPAQAVTYSAGSGAAQVGAIGEMRSAKPYKIREAKVSVQSVARASKPRKIKSAKKSKGSKVTFYEGSAESRSERDRRLSRECKGRSNSGVCEGYTR